VPRKLLNNVLADLVSFCKAPLAINFKGALYKCFYYYYYYYYSRKLHELSVFYPFLGANCSIWKKRGLTTWSTKEQKATSIPEHYFIHAEQNTKLQSNYSFLSPAME
jgi:hypothetical protein